MPCDQIITTSLDLFVANTDRLESALQILGFQTKKTPTGFSMRHSQSYISGYYNKQEGLVLQTSQYASRDNKSLVSEIRRKYSELTVKDAAKKFKWNVTQTSANKFVLRKI
jgi:hypothetical protein